MPDSLPAQIARPASLDAVDLSMLAELERNGRLTNAALAARVGIAESTCTQRLRSLRDRGVIRGFRADIDPASLGLTLQALITVRLGTHGREQVRGFEATARSLPNVLTTFHVAGADDYLLHVAVSSASALRELVLEHLTTHPHVRHVETQLVFEVLEGAGMIAPLTP
ncbi:MAG: Lrp/AsnC family transcriptional regulator [Microcella sp.]|nr:Lrp/AsnC family transcriptional regulator [Microcella sp.]